jgi:hypothetical protein
MAMSDCEKCWETPCCCGYDYRKYQKPYRIALAAVILGVPEREIERRLKVPDKHPRHAEK